jgi:alpha-ketoglutarate-dependent taurine dioxygenase
MEDPAVQWRHRLQAGQLLLLNNRRFLHGREPFQDGDQPHLRRWLVRMYGVGQ